MSFTSLASCGLRPLPSSASQRGCVCHLLYVPQLPREDGGKGGYWAGGCTGQWVGLEGPRVLASVGTKWDTTPPPPLPLPPTCVFGSWYPLLPYLGAGAGEFNSRVKFEISHPSLGEGPTVFSPLLET